MGHAMRVTTQPVSRVGGSPLRGAVRLRDRAPVRFATEFSLLGGLLALYLALRYQMKGDIADALDNARRVVDFEKAAGFFTENALQKWALEHVGVIKFLNTYYLVAHFSVMGLFMLWAFFRQPRGYRSCRRVLIAMTAIGLAIHAVYPLAPPRMLSEYGFIDTGRLLGPSPYTDTSKGLANQFAAMPSLHFGWALLVAWGAWHYGRTRYRKLLVLHPILTLAAIIITANHYWIDAIVALLIFGGAMFVGRVASRVTRRARGDRCHGHRRRWRRRSSLNSHYGRPRGLPAEAALDRP